MGLAASAIVAIALTVPVSLAAPDASAQDQPAQAGQTTPEADAATPTDSAGVPAGPGTEPPGSGVTTESSEPAAVPPAAEEPVSQTGDAAGGGSPKPADTPPTPAHAPAEPAQPAEPVSPTGVREAKPIPAARPDTIDPPGQPAPSAKIDEGANGSIAATNGHAEVEPAERSSAETLTRSPAVGTTAGAPMTCFASPVSCAALQPDPVELRRRPSARPRAEKANRRADGTPRNLPVRMPRVPDSAVCSSSGACAAGPLGMMPVLAALGCLCAFMLDRLLQVADRWRSHRFVSLRERPG
jgi:ribonuclease E